MFKSRSSVLKTFVRCINTENFSKTSAIFLGESAPNILIIDSYSESGFRLNNGFLIHGSLVIFPKSVFSWNVRSVKDINEDSLTLFQMLEPKVDILVIGVGDKQNKVDPNVIMYLKNKGLNLEVLPTEQACTTFNFLVSEGRFAAAALLPPTKLLDFD